MQYKNVLPVVLIAFAAFTFTACDDEQKAQFEQKAIEIENNIASKLLDKELMLDPRTGEYEPVYKPNEIVQTVQQTAETAAPFLPPPFGTGLAIASTVLSAGLGAWIKRLSGQRRAAENVSTKLAHAIEVADIDTYSGIKEEIHKELVRNGGQTEVAQHLEKIKLSKS
ncbi:MAG: hypothetical protein AAF571_13225 [Verrucomicrobiota bacterium]